MFKFKIVKKLLVLGALSVCLGVAGFRSDTVSAGTGDYCGQTCIGGMLYNLYLNGNGVCWKRLPTGQACPIP
jgi:hypothetical protein